MTQRLEAFTEIMPTLPAKRRAVWSAINAQGSHGATLAELTVLLSWTINRISGRVSEISELGYLREAGVRGGQTVWVACLPQEVKDLPRRPRLVKARVENIESPDLFGRTRILVSVPTENIGRGLKTSDPVGIRL